MSKAYICFCVDGQSDIDALQVPISDLFNDVFDDDVEVRFRYAKYQEEGQGDITTLKGVDVNNVEKMIYKLYFKEQDVKSDIGWNDFTYIIHIIDTDGAYVPDDKIKEFTDDEKELAKNLATRGKAKRTLYLDDHIGVTDDDKTSTVSYMIDRNQRKRAIIEHLVDIDSITIGKKTIGYSLYYFSSNIDHFLYGDANLTGPQKMQKASDFERFYGDAQSLIEFFKSNKYCTKGDYYSSWKQLRKESLNRGTNVNLLIDRILDSEIDEWL